MIVPQFWADARCHQPRAKGQPQVTVRRFGWSDTSQEDAQQMATQRAEDAFRRIISGEKLPKREPKIGYNGAQGVPIREEILSRHNDVIVTRNAYGAHCLNTPDVLFADLDFKTYSSSFLNCGIILMLLAGAATAGYLVRSRAVGVITFFAVLFLGTIISKIVDRISAKFRPDQETLVRQRIDTVLKSYSSWRVRLYRTPAGFRLLVLHRLFKPDEPEVLEFFQALETDPVYVQMCQNQHCFRARVSPKPWRIGIKDHMRPRPGVWPVNAANLDARNKWVRAYEEASKRFASCRFVETFGSSAVHAKAAAVCELHDRLSQALSGLDIA